MKHFQRRKKENLLKKRITALFIVLMTVFSLFACENVEYPSESSQNGEYSNVYDQLAGDLPDINENGAPLEEKTFYILTDDGSLFTRDESSEGTINEAVRKRDEFLRQKYGANVKVRTEKTKTIVDELNAANASGNEFCDMLAISAKDTINLYLDGLLCNMNSLPDFDAQGEYFDKTNSTALAMNEELYLLADPSTRYFNEIYTMFFNRDLIQASGCENPETLAAQGKWTWDKFDEIEKTVAAEVMNKTSADLASDVFGFAAYYNSGNYGNVMYVSCGRPFVENTYYNEIDFSLEVEEAVAIGKYLYRINDSKARLPYEGDVASNAFKNGRLAFFTNKLAYLSALRDGTKKGSEFGILPMPKYNEQQEKYCCLVDPAARVISVPRTVDLKDQSYKKFVGAVISGMCAVSGKTVKDAFLSDTIIKSLNDNGEAVMLKTIVESAVFDFSSFYGSRIGAVHNATVNAICEYIDVGSDMRNTISANIDAFRNSAKSNFR